MKLRASRVAALALTGLFALNTHAALFEDDDARKAILELRQKVEANRLATDAAQARLLQQVTEENTQLKRSLLDLQGQIEALRSELAKLRGENEQLARDVAELQRRQKDISQGVDDRLRKFEPVKVSLDGSEFLADPAEKRDYDAAMAVFRKGDFAAAQTALADFVRRNPQSGYRPSALFWLGNAQYATRDYKDAITNFRSLLAKSPDHVRAPEAVLSIANCQIELKNTKAARKTLEDLAKAYPQSEAAAAGKERLARLK